MTRSALERAISSRSPAPSFAVDTRNPSLVEVFADEIANILLVIDDQYVFGFDHKSADLAGCHKHIVEDIYGYNFLQKEARLSSSGCEPSLNSPAF